MSLKLRGFFSWEKSQVMTILYLMDRGDIMESKRELKKRQNRQSMIEAALLLFSQKPFAEVSVRDIAKLAEVSPALIYKYFDDQQHLFLIAMQQENEKLINELKKYDTIESLSQGYLIYFFSNNTLYKMMTYFMISPNNESVSTIIVDEMNQLYNLFKENIMKLGHIKNPQQETGLLFSTLNGFLITYQNLPVFTNEHALNKTLSLLALYLERFEKD